MDLILSIKPKYARYIYSGEKTWEFRRVLPMYVHEDDRVWIYETAYVKAITGFFVAGRKYKQKDFDIFWDRVGSTAGIYKESLQEYFKGKRPQALHIKNNYKLSNPIPSNLVGWKRPPQNFAYCESIPNCFLQTLGYPFNWGEDK